MEDGEHRELMIAAIAAEGVAHAALVAGDAEAATAAYADAVERSDRLRRALVEGTRPDGEPGHHAPTREEHRAGDDARDRGDDQPPHDRVARRRRRCYWPGGTGSGIGSGAGSGPGGIGSGSGNGGGAGVSPAGVVIGHVLLRGW